MDKKRPLHSLSSNTLFLEETTLFLNRIGHETNHTKPHFGHYLHSLRRGKVVQCELLCLRGEAICRCLLLGWSCLLGYADCRFGMYGRDLLRAVVPKARLYKSVQRDFLRPSHYFHLALVHQLLCSQPIR